MEDGIHLPFRYGYQDKTSNTEFLPASLPVHLVTIFPGIHLVHLLPFLVRQAELPCEQNYKGVAIGLVEE